MDSRDYVGWIVMNERQVFRLSYGIINNADEVDISEHGMIAYYAEDCVCMALETITHTKPRRSFHPCDEHENIRDEVSLSELHQTVTDKYRGLVV